MIVDGEVAGLDLAGPFDSSSTHSAIGHGSGYWLRVSELTVLGVTIADFALTVFPLGHGLADVHGLVGMNFLRYFNFQVRHEEQHIVLDLIDPALAADG